jgi:hypothetical protein
VFMENSKLISLLKLFSQKEFKEFGRFVYSPFFNRLNNIKKFYEAIKPFHPDFPAKNVIKEKIYAFIFPGENFNYWKFKNLTSDMLDNAENFLAFKRFREDKFAVKKYLLDELTSKGDTKEFEKNLKEIEKELLTGMIKGENNYYNKYQAELAKGSFQFYKKDFLKENNLREITDNFLNYALIRILKLYTYMINEELVFKSGNTKLVLINEIIDHIKQYTYSDTPAIRIYYLILMLTMKNGDGYYYELKEFKSKNKKNLSADETYNIDTVLRNFCTKMVLQGNKLFLKEYFEMLKVEIFDNLDNMGNFISHFRFMNAVITATRLNEINWAEEFITQYGEYLDPMYKNETINLTTAILFFAKKQFEPALIEIQKINFDDCHHKMHLRNLTLQIYYELGYYESAISLIDSYRHFLRRESSLSDFYRDYNENFVKYFSDILKINMGDSNIHADEFRHNLENASEFANKDWIMNKIDTIISS